MTHDDSSDLIDEQLEDARDAQELRRAMAEDDGQRITSAELLVGFDSEETSPELGISTSV